MGDSKILEAMAFCFSFGFGACLVLSLAAGFPFSGATLISACVAGGAVTFLGAFFMDSVLRNGLTGERLAENERERHLREQDLKRQKERKSMMIGVMSEYRCTREEAEEYMAIRSNPDKLDKWLERNKVNALGEKESWELVSKICREERK